MIECMCLRENQLVLLMVAGRLAGRFRATDLRWGTQVHTIVKVVVRGGSSPLYKVDGINAMFPREQLKLSSKVPAGKEKAVARS